GVEVVLEHVAHGHQLDARSGPQHIRGRPGAPLAAADQSDADHVAARGVSAGNRAQTRCDSSAHHRRRGPFEKVPPRGAVGTNIRWLLHTVPPCKAVVSRYSKMMNDE